MPRWAYYNPTNILFCDEALETLGQAINCKQSVLVTSPGFRRRGVVDRIERIMNGRVVHVIDTVTPNPSVDDLMGLAALEWLHDIDSIVAVGGGSTIDTAKIMSRIASCAEDLNMPDDLWNGVTPSGNVRVPVYAIPTTSGTGSEVTPTATVWDYARGVKRSLSGDDLFPKMAILDPVLTYDLPRNITVSSGLDAISHALESVWNRNANPLTLISATQSLRMSLDALPRLVISGEDFPARRSMMQASLMAGLAISQTKTALSHSMSYPLTIEYGIPHGIACSFALPEILEFNASADDGRLENLAIELGFETIADLVGELRRILEMSIPHDGSISNIQGRVTSPELLKRMFSKGRMENNIRPATLEDLDRIVQRAVNRY